VKVLGAGCWVLVLGAVLGASAQTQMPSAAEERSGAVGPPRATRPGGVQGAPPATMMSGVPLPDPQLPVGTLTIRVVRGALTNNLPNQKVELTVSGERREATTDAAGRAEFRALGPGDRVQAFTIVDGARVESQVIAMPAQGGVRVMLVAPDAGSAAQEAEDAKLRSAPAQPGVVVFGGESRFIVERGDEALNVFYVLDISNTARTPIATTAPLIFDLPSGAQGVTLLEGSTPQATVSGSRVTVTSPFAPGNTPLHIAYELPYRGSRVTIEQKLPAALRDLAVAGETTGGVTMTSAQFQTTRDMTNEGKAFKVGNGPGLAAGGTMAITFDNLPHHARWPRFTALGIAVAILIGGLVLAFSKPRAEAAADRKALADARHSRFQQLESLEAARRNGGVSAEDYAMERARLVGELEDIYARLDGPAH